MEPLKVGTRVRYSGSITERHGEYIVRAAEPLDRFFSPDDIRRKEYSDDTAYYLWPAHLPFKFDLREYSLSRVRRSSITEVEQ